MIFALLTLFSALAVAAVAGWFSIIGVMAIYAGAPFHSALVMGVVLELAKLITTSWVYRNWTLAGWGLKGPLIYFTVALMLATSIGVFGFLSKAHLEQGSKTIDNGPRVERIEQQIAREKAVITDNEKVITQLDATINSYLGKDRTDRSVSIRRSQAPQRKQLKDEIDSANKRIDGFSEEKFKLQSEIRALELEVGPIRYIAELIYGSENGSSKNVEGAVKIFTLLIVSTLDPLAIILLVAANHSLLRRQDEKKKKIVEEGEKLGNTQPTSLAVPAEADPNLSLRTADKTFELRPPTYEETTIHAEIPQETMEIVNETSEKTVIEDNSGEEGLPDISFEIPADIVRAFRSQEPETDAHADAEKEIQEEIIEKTMPVLARFPFTTHGAPLPIIRSPNPSQVTTPTVSSTVIEEPTTAEIPQETETNAYLRWENQTAVMRELLGTGPHFIPQKINEEEKLTQVETSAETSQTTSHSAAGKVTQIEEIHQERQAADQTTRRMEGSFISSPSSFERLESHKYPKALSWLKEFTRT